MGFREKRLCFCIKFVERTCGGEIPGSRTGFTVNHYEVENREIYLCVPVGENAEKRIALARRSGDRNIGVEVCIVAVGAGLTLVHNLTVRAVPREIGIALIGVDAPLSVARFPRTVADRAVEKRYVVEIVPNNLVVNRDVGDHADRVVLARSCARTCESY